MLIESVSKKEQKMQSKIDLEPNYTIVFTGDSITDADKDLAAYQPFGFGYVHFVATFVKRDFNLVVI